jgi:hypothetical protein
MLSRFGRRRDDRGGEQAVVPSDALSDGVDSLLAEVAAIEATACDVYGRHGLPAQPGQYRRQGENGAWEKLGDQLTPAEKWAMIQAAPSEEGWRFASLDSIGARSTTPEIRHASAVLAACRGLRQRLTDAEPITPQDLADAIRLGAAWRRLDAESAASPLLFQPLASSR